MFFIEGKKKICLLLPGALLWAAVAFAQPTLPSVSPSPYPVKIVQPDSTELHIMGKMEAGIAYTETADGYTIGRNAEGVYEYLLPAAGGNLKLSGLKAKDKTQRTVAERKFLKTLSLHIRHTDAFLNNRQRQLKDSHQPNLQP